MKIAIYARVSTDKQSTENQLRQLREFAARQPEWEITKEYVDDGITGRKNNRDEFQQMWSDASRRKFDFLLFWALDRLSREGALETLHYLKRLESYGIGYRSFTEPYFDSCGVFKEAIIAIMATLAKQESIKMSERTKAGLARARAKGKIIGRPRLNVKSSEITALRGQGLSNRAIGKQLGVSEGYIRLCVKTAI
jgi:DNA invertase Pin-like site-specific DNA recombinase